MTNKEDKNKRLSPEEFIDGLLKEETKYLNKNCDIYDGKLFFGFKIKLNGIEEDIFLLSNGKFKRGDLAVTFYNPEIDVQQYQISRDGIFKFVRKEKIDTAKLYKDIINIIKDYQELREEAEYHLVALWIIHAPIINFFCVTPYIHLLGGENSGKTNLMLICVRLTNKGELITSPTRATLFRSTHTNQNVLYLDEFENYDMQIRRDVLDVINSGYRKGAIVKRAAANNYEQIKSYNVFSAKMMASVNQLNIKTLKSRMIEINTIRTNKLLKDIDELTEEEEKRFNKLRDDVLIWHLQNFESVKTTYKSLEIPEWLTARDKQIIKPILALAKIFGVEQLILDYYKNKIEEKHDELLEGDWDYKLLKYLYVDLGERELKSYTPSEIAVGLNKAYPTSEKQFEFTPKSIGRRLRRLNFKMSRSTGSRVYGITKKKVLEMIDRLGYKKYLAQTDK
ncbi:hypothetical protein HYS31_03975 [Candidatus Woesearchaeota archaeon]|nr:hypothetical protein [Candidatus Woesearchaeota archaeon]